jgi:hypothetical protein
MRKLLSVLFLITALDAAAATPIWIGNAPAVKQIGTFTVTAYDGGTPTTYKITIGGVTVSQIGTGGTTTTTATALTAALVASTHPYFTAVTWTSSSNVITATATIAGVPFVATSSVTSGTGTIGAYAVVTASSGPSDWSTAANWSTGAVPVNSDDVVISDSTLNISFGLNQSGVTLNSLRIAQSFTGLLGLNRSVFTTSADGSTNNTLYTEYQPLYLQVGLSGSQLVVIGESNSTSGSTLAGARRIMLDLGSSAGTVEIQNTASSAAETSRPAVRIKCNNASLNCFVRSAPGGFGIAIDQNGETSVLGKMEITDTTGVSKVVSGLGTTLTTWEQYSGTNKLQAGATVTTVNVKAGTLQIEGSFATTTLNLYAGTLKTNSTGTITTMNLYGGTVDFTGSSRARTVTTLNWQAGSTATLTADMSVLTIGTFNPPTTKFSFTAR